MKHPKKPHGGAGNQNAAKPPEQRVDAQIVVCCLTQEKAAWTQAAKSKGTPVSRWVRNQLNKATTPKS